MLTFIKFVNNLTHLSIKITNATFFFYLIMPIITNKNENYKQILHNSEKKKPFDFGQNIT